MMKRLISGIKKNKEYWYEGYRGCLELLSGCPEIRTKFEMYRVKDSLCDYLNSKPTSAWYNNWIMWTDKEMEVRRFGIQCFDTLRAHTNKALSAKTFDFGATAAFALMAEHKALMYKRIILLFDKGVPISKELIEKYHTDVEQRCN